MTPQEQEMIQGLIDRVQGTQLPEKDSEAEALLQQSLGRNPDSLYILAQTVLVQKYALDQAQKQLTDLKSQVSQQQQQQPQHHTSFLGSLLGRNDPPPPPPASSQPQYAPVPGYQPQGQPGYGAAPAGYGGSPSFGGAPQSGGFLRGAMQTAAGVAAGALAFQGVESLMHGFGGGGGFGGGQGLGGFGGGAPREEVINNYYGDDTNRDGGSNLSPDVEDRRGDSTFGDRLEAADSDTSSDDTGSDYGDNSADNSSDFDSSSDDSSTFDSGGGDDSNFS